MDIINDSCRSTLSNTKKQEQAQKRQKKCEVDEFQLQSSSIAEVSFQDEAPAAKRLQSSLGWFMTKMCLVLQTRISKASRVKAFVDFI